MTNRNLLSRLSRVDWDFAGRYSESPFSSIHFHPSRFASQLPATLIGLLSKPGELVVDPFVGSGTTLIEAQRLNRKSIGIDLNPIAVLTTRAKTIAKPAEVLLQVIHVIKHEAKVQLSDQLSTLRPKVACAVPQSVQAAKWYTPEVVADLGVLWSVINRLGSETRMIAEAAFSAILLAVCRETRQWGYVCDNTTPKSNHGADVLHEFLQVLERIEGAYKDRDAEIAAAGRMSSPIPNARTLCGDTETLLGTLATGCIDLLVTSPPYFGVCDYVKAQRLSMEWFGKEIEPLRRQEIGARSKRHRASASEQYLRELCSTFRQIRRCLKRRAFAAVIMGESATRAGVLPHVRDMFADVGLKCSLELNRTVSAQRRLAPSILGEHVFILSR